MSHFVVKGALIGVAETYAKEWRLMGKMTAEEPGEAVNGHHS